MKNVKFTLLLFCLIFVTACSPSGSSDGMSEDAVNVHLQYACAEVDAYNDLVDAGDMETANEHWARVLEIQNNLNRARPDSQIDPFDWGLICQ